MCVLGGQPAPSCKYTTPIGTGQGSESLLARRLWRHTLVGKHPLGRVLLLEHAAVLKQSWLGLAKSVRAFPRNFIPGIFAHYFGWTGPGMTLDTACSASAVAIHTACRAILSSECPDGAMAGRVWMMASLVWCQNLTGATFLSPTGQCKLFDEAADGYCRGAGIACLFLKKCQKRSLIEINSLAV